MFDAHEISEVGTNACWIKADLTFEGLRQILAEPERIFFDEPDIINRIRKNPDKFIKYIYDENNDFQVNPELETMDTTILNSYGIIKYENKQKLQREQPRNNVTNA